MRVLIYLFETLRYPVALAVLIGLAGVFYTGGFAGLGRVMKLIGSGILMNGAAVLVVIGLYRLGRIWWARRTRAKETQRGDM